MYIINAVLSPIGPDVIVTAETLDDVVVWFKEHRPKFGYWDWLVTSPDGTTVPDFQYIR